MLRLDPGTTFDWWFDTLPDRPYQAQLCLFSPEYGLHPVLDSNVVHTPPVAISGATADEEESFSILPLLQELAQKTGLSFEVAASTPTSNETPAPSRSGLESSFSRSGQEERVDTHPPEIPLPRPTSR